MSVSYVQFVNAKSKNFSKIIYTYLANRTAKPSLDFFLIIF